MNEDKYKLRLGRKNKGTVMNMVIHGLVIM